jgi:hypothetical protein
MKTPSDPGDSDGRGMAGGSIRPTGHARDFLGRLFRQEGYSYANTEAATEHYLPGLLLLLENRQMTIEEFILDEHPETHEGQYGDHSPLSCPACSTWFLLKRHFERVFDTEKQAEQAAERARIDQEANWHGQHSMEVFEIEV